MQRGENSFISEGKGALRLRRVGMARHQPRLESLNIVDTTSSMLTFSKHNEGVLTEKISVKRAGNFDKKGAMLSYMNCNGLWYFYESVKERRVGGYEADHCGDQWGLGCYLWDSVVGGIEGVEGGGPFSPF
jgi:hypothetical protein